MALQGIDMEMEAHLRASAMINWQHPEIIQLAQQIALGQETVTAIVQGCFEWVRDEIRHSVDYQLNPITCRASDVLKYKTGYCFVKMREYWPSSPLIQNDTPYHL